MKEKYIVTANGKMFVRFSSEFVYEKTIVWLHGWGRSSEEFYPFLNEFKQFNHLFVDALGFGKSDEPNKALKLNDYVNYLNVVINEFKISDPILIGHSFGGRIAINYSYLYPTYKVFLVSAKAFKNKSIKYWFSVYKYKLKRNLFKIFNKEKYHKLITSSGSVDYKNASLVMKETMKNIVNDDLESKLKKINCECVVLGSINDSVVRYDETLKIHTLLRKSVLYPFYKSDHFLHLEEKDKFINILKKELE